MSWTDERVELLKKLWAVIKLQQEATRGHVENNAGVKFALQRERCWDVHRNPFVSSL